MDVRIYFESLEQATYFIYPIIDDALKEIGGTHSIKMVKLKGNYKYYSKKTAPILFWKDPDAMITCIKNGVEYPLLLVEFSNAVFTEDHELQRFDGLVAAARNNCFYAKISPSSKSSPSAHGGNTDFDFTLPYVSIQKKYDKTFFHFEWKCDENGVVEIEENFPSCPKRIKSFESFMNSIIILACKKDISNDWMTVVVSKLKSDPFFSNWISRLTETSNIDFTKFCTSRTKWIPNDSILKKGALELKLNRFGHAMDPERGMLAYYGTICENVVSKMLLSEDNDSWYKDTAGEEQIRKYIKSNGLTNPYDYLFCFALGSGLHRNKSFMNIIAGYKNDSSKSILIDLTEFIQDNFFKLNKPLRTIFGYSSLFAIENRSGEKKVIFKWESYEEPAFFDKYPLTTAILERYTLDEDDVTYISIHNILVPNGYTIIAASYPGSQADRRILIEPGTGRRQPRRYIDIVSFLPNKYTSLQENKGPYSTIAVQSDIQEIVKYKTDPAYSKGLKEFQKMFAPESLKTIVKIGVGFWSDEAFSISKVRDLDLVELDYFVYITNDRKSWNIWSNGKNEMFQYTKGDVKTPQTYAVQSSGILGNPLSQFL